jgi:hypothetical protein
MLYMENGKTISATKFGGKYENALLGLSLVCVPLHVAIITC